MGPLLSSGSTEGFFRMQQWHRLFGKMQALLKEQNDVDEAMVGSR